MAWRLSRRSWLHLTGLGSVAGSVLTGARLTGQGTEHRTQVPANRHSHVMGTVGRVPTDSFNPTSFLRTWNFSDQPDEHRSAFYRETPRPDGTMLREYQLHAVDREIEIAPGLFFPAWT